MTISELIKALAELQEKHGDLPVFADDEEHEPYEVDFAEYVNSPPVMSWGNDLIPGWEGVLLQPWYASDEAMEQAVKIAFEGEGSVNLVSFDKDGVTITV